MCNLYPIPHNIPDCPANAKSARNVITNVQKTYDTWCEDDRNADVCQGLNLLKNGFDDAKERFESFTPAQDLDRDLFASVHGTLRGWWWRGKDCSDLDSDVYPGKTPVNDDIYFDSDCNDIKGISEGGAPLENIYCDNSERRGVAILGDSAGAHFSIPEVWFRPYQWTKRSTPFEDWKIAAANELDWPQMSWVTGFTDRCWNTGPVSWVKEKNVDSIYSRLVKRNRCNLNDFQNQSNNGCKSWKMADTTIFGLGRNPLDRPMLIFLSLVGNDVCNMKNATEDAMTTPDVFRTETMKSLNYLDSILPSGSAVVLTGMAQGELLWDNLHDRIHPLGEFNNDVTYQQFYEYLECMDESPCRGWMTANATRRAFTTERAETLTQVSRDIAAVESFNQFELIYMDYDLERIFDMHVADGGEAWQGIEVTDGFHPSQTANVLLAQMFWEQLEAQYPHVLGKENEKNEEIEAIQRHTLLDCSN